MRIRTVHSFMHLRNALPSQTPELTHYPISTRTCKKIKCCASVLLRPKLPSLYDKSTVRHPAFDGEGTFLVEARLTTTPQHWLLRIYTDTPKDHIFSDSSVSSPQIAIDLAFDFGTTSIDRILDDVPFPWKVPHNRLLELIPESRLVRYIKGDDLSQHKFIAHSSIYLQFVSQFSFFIAHQTVSFNLHNPTFIFNERSNSTFDPHWSESRAKKSPNVTSLATIKANYKKHAVTWLKYHLWAGMSNDKGVPPFPWEVSVPLMGPSTSKVRTGWPVDDLIQYSGPHCKYPRLLLGNFGTGSSVWVTRKLLVL